MTKKIVVIALGTLIAVGAAASAQVQYDGIILARSNKWDSYPTHLFDGSKHKIWWCSTSTVGGTFGRYVDGIFYSVKSGGLGPGGWSWPQEVFNNSQSSWASSHVCDPSVVRGNFSFGGNSYAYALYWTSDTNLTTPEVDNAVGVAFSNNGTSWTARSQPVITGYNPYNGTYGAGAGGAAFDLVTGKLMFAYDDSTMDPSSSRAKESSDGITFSPTPPYLTQLRAAGRNGFANSPDIAYNSFDRHWYAAVQTWDPQGRYSGETRVLRSAAADDLFGSWTVVGMFNSSVTGLTLHNNPGLGKNLDSSLYIDSQGWAYAFFGAGAHDDPWGWDVGRGGSALAALPAAPWWRWLPLPPAISRYPRPATPPPPATVRRVR